MRRLLFISSVRGANNLAVLDWDRAFSVASGVNTDAVTDCARVCMGNNFDGAISATDENTDAVTDLGLCSLMGGDGSGCDDDDDDDDDGSNNLDVTALKLLFTTAGGVQLR